MGGAASASRGTGAPTLAFGLALGFLSLLGPLSIDLYLPAMPEMAAAFGARDGTVQRTLAAFFLGLAAAQIPIGALGDRFGRRRPLIAGLALFAAASIACALARDMNELVAARFVQGIGACTGTAIARAVIRDLHSGHAAARLMAFSFLVIGISPVLAPLLGSALLTMMPWRGLFVTLAAGGAIAIAVAATFLPESLPPERRSPAGTPILRGCGQLLANRRFLGWAVTAGLVTTIPFAYVTAAPFVFTGVFGLSSHVFTIFLAVNAGASIATTQIAPALMRRRGGPRLVRRVAVAALAATLALAAAALAGAAPLPVFLLWSILAFAAAGLMLTPSAITALDAARGGAGAASGLVGTIQLAVTALASAAVSLFPSFSILPLTLVLAVALAITIVLAGASGGPVDLATKH